MPQDRVKEVVEKINTMLKKRYGSDSPEMQKRLFDDYDVNNDGKITKDELGALLKAADIGNFASRTFYVSGIMEKMDSGASIDGGISWDEYQTVILEANQP